MLAEADHLLLTAYVDGELSSRQYRLVLKLLHRSGEARTLLQQLQEQARTLRQLPKVRLRQDLSESVLRRIHERRLKTRTRSARAFNGAYPVWAGYAAAAAVLFVVCAGSYLFFANAFGQPSAPAVAHQALPDNVKKPEQPAFVNPLVKILPVPEGPETLPIMPRVQPNAETPIVQAPSIEATKPFDPDAELDKPKDPTVFTAPATEMLELKMVDIAAPFIVKLQEVEQANAKALLLADLNKATGFRIEFPCRNGTRGFERFAAACKSQNITLHVDQFAAERLKHPAFKSNYAIYLEDVTAEELTRLLQQVAVEDKKAEGKKPVECQFERIVMVRLSKRDRKELADLLGSDPTVPAALGPLGVDLHKPLAEQTESQIAAALATKSNVKATERLALALPYTPFRPSANSVEIKRYFEARKPARTGTLQIFLVIRETGA